MKESGSTGVAGSMAVMSTSADPNGFAPPLAEPRFRLVESSYAAARAAGLLDLLQAEYVRRYGSPDETPMDDDEFAPPLGRLLIGYLDGAAVACGAWRTLGPGRAEIKRMFVAAAARRRGLAARILNELEGSARQAGMTRMVLETGDAQPEAVQMYTRAGYRVVEGYGYYRCSPQSISMAKSLMGQGAL